MKNIENPYEVSFHIIHCLIYLDLAGPDPDVNYRCTGN